MSSISRADPQSPVTSAESASSKTVYFYQDNLLTTEFREAVTRHILRANGKVLAQVEQPDAIKILRIDDTNTVLGASPEAMTYSPYGYIARKKILELIAFHGQLLDPITQSYSLGNGHRMYHISIRRFGKADTLSPFDEGGLNAYAYCMGDPVNREDPTGRWGRRFRGLFSKTPKYKTISKLVTNDKSLPKLPVTIAKMEDNTLPTYQQALAKWGQPGVSPPKYTEVPYQGQTTKNINLGETLKPISDDMGRQERNRLIRLRNFYQTHQPNGPEPEKKRFNDISKVDRQILIIMHRRVLALRQ